MQLQSKNLNKSEGVTLYYLEILLQGVFRIWFCIPALGLAGQYLCSGRFNSIGNQLTVDSYIFVVAPRSPAPLGPAVRASDFPVSGPQPCTPPPPYSIVISSGSRSPFRGLVAVCWWVRDNPAPRARARAQVAALATRGTVGMCIVI